MSKIITLRKGLDINLVGKPQESLAEAPLASEYALSPLDFEGVTPKLLVKEGDKVKAGTPLFFNKANERILFTSPVSGTVVAVNTELENAPEVMNSDPYGAGWIVRVKLSAQPEGLMDAAAYEEHCKNEQH